MVSGRLVFSNDCGFCRVFCLLQLFILVVFLSIDVAAAVVSAAAAAAVAAVGCVDVGTMATSLELSFSCGTMASVFSVTWCCLQ